MDGLVVSADTPWGSSAVNSSDGSSPPQLLLINRHDPLVRDGLPGLICLLSTEERQCLQRYRRSEDRERYLLGRAALRLVFAHLLGKDPACLSFGRGAQGKPYLIPQAGDREAPVHFNLSHSGAFVLFGFHASMEVGVDVEQVHLGMDWVPIARRCLDRENCEYLLSLPADQQLKGFLRQWCRLEASLKAQGVGLSGLSCVASVDEAPSLSRLWDVQLPEGYAGAAATTVDAGMRRIEHNKPQS
jgi:4'-phosphopantetheinyl transferase